MPGKFRKIQAIFWAVTVHLAKGKNKFDKEAIEVKYTRLDTDDFDDFRTRNATNEEMSTEETANIGLAIVEEIKSYIVDWKIDDEDGKPMECTPENIEMVFGHPDYANAIVKGFWAMQVGGAAKN